MTCKDVIKILLCSYGYDRNIKVETYFGDCGVPGYEVEADHENGDHFYYIGCECLMFIVYEILDYIANFTRNIPIDCIRKKLEIDKLCVFDNYCVLHYDPEGTGMEKTDEEKQKEAIKKKDPIIFGLINGSKKLYHICSFEDEYCDLTFDKLTEIVGKEVVESGFLNEHIK